MNDQDRSKQQLIEELAEMRRQVAECKRIEEERDRDRATLAAAIECLPFEFFAIGADGRYMLQNATLREHYGNAIGKRPEDYAHEESTRQLWLDNNRRAFAGERVEGEVEAHISGETRTYYNIISPIRDGGKVCGILGVNVDITERKRAEEALRTSEAKYRRLHRSMRDAFVSVDMDGPIREYNEAYLTMLGYEPEELLKLRYMDLTPEKWHSYEAEIVQNQILRWGHSEIYEKEYRRKDGTVFPVELRTFLIKDDHGQPSAMWAIVRDITERKRAEEALREAHDELEQRVQERTAELAKATENLRQSLDELQAIYDGMPDGLIITDIETLQFIRVNAAICQMLGYTGTELRSLAVSDIHPIEALPYILEKIRTVEKAKLHVSRTIPVLRKDGSEFYAEVIGNCLTYNGRPCAMGIFRDITERKRAEEALRASEERFRVAFEEAPLGILMVVGEGILVRANRTFCQMSGYSEEELIGKPVRDVMHPEDREQFEALDEQVRAGVIPGFTTEKRYLRKTGDSSGGRSRLPRFTTGAAM